MDPLRAKSPRDRLIQGHTRVVHDGAAASTKSRAADSVHLRGGNSVLRVARNHLPVPQPPPAGLALVGRGEIQASRAFSYQAAPGLKEATLLKGYRVALLPQHLLRFIAKDFLLYPDAVRFSRICKQILQALPKEEVMKGRDYEPWIQDRDRRMRIAIQKSNESWQKPREDSYALVSTYYLYRGFRFFF